MNWRRAIQSFPWGLTVYFYISSMAIGLLFGGPIAAKCYDLTIGTEVDELFFLLPVVLFFLSIPLCMVAAAGARHPRIACSRALRLAYIMLATLLVPAIFYGIAVTTYYH